MNRNESIVSRRTISARDVRNFAVPTIGVIGLATSACGGGISINISPITPGISSPTPENKGLSANVPSIPTMGAPLSEKTILTPEKIANLPYFNINGAPNSVNAKDLPKWANEAQPAPGDITHKNTIGLNTEGFLAEPGVRTADDLDDIGPDDDGKSVWLTSGGHQQILTSPSAYWPLNEDGFAMITTAQAQIEFNGITAQFGRMENNGWIIFVKGLPRHNQQNTDNNVQMTISNYDPGFTMATMLPAGQYISEKFSMQNVKAVHGEYGKQIDPSGLGVDGARYASVALIDAKTGAFTVIKHDSQTGKWTLIKTNINK